MKGAQLDARVGDAAALELFTDERSHAPALVTCGLGVRCRDGGIEIGLLELALGGKVGAREAFMHPARLGRRAPAGNDQRACDDEGDESDESDESAR